MKKLNSDIDFTHDIILVGAGPSNVFCAYKLINANPKLKILMIEKGNSIENRKCPKRELGKCVKCSPCNITTGFSGAGAFSDGKLTLASSETGGSLSELIGEDTVKSLLKEMDNIYLSFGADKHLYGVQDTAKISEICKKAIQSNMKLIDSPIRHLGTDGSYEIYTKLHRYLLDHNVEIKFGTMVTDLLIDMFTDNDSESDTYKKAVNSCYGVKTNKGETYMAPLVVVGAGREGSAWFKNICNKYSIDTCPGTVDIGVRVECRNEVMAELNEAMYESKLVYHTKTYADKVRTFCQNPSGEVTLENYKLPDGSDIVTVNGHSYKGEGYKTNNTNFALLVSKNFTEPFKDSLEYGAAYAKIANMLAGGNVLVQAYGDLKRGRRSTPERLKYGNVVPTLKDAEAGDLSLVLPHRILVDIIEMIESMDKIVPGIANDETLLYGVEVKFYSNKVLIDKNCETNINNLFSIGDSSSWTRGLSMSSAMGLYVGDKILENIDNILS